MTKLRYTILLLATVMLAVVSATIATAIVYHAETRQINVEMRVAAALAPLQKERENLQAALIAARKAEAVPRVLSRSEFDKLRSQLLEAAFADTKKGLRLQGYDLEWGDMINGGITSTLEGDLTQKKIVALDAKIAGVEKSLQKAPVGVARRLAVVPTIALSHWDALAVFIAVFCLAFVPFLLKLARKGELKNETHEVVDWDNLAERISEANPGVIILRPRKIS